MVMVIFFLVTHELLWYLHVCIPYIETSSVTLTKGHVMDTYASKFLNFLAITSRFLTPTNPLPSKPFHNNVLPHDHEITSRVFLGWRPFMPGHSLLFLRAGNNNNNNNNNVPIRPRRVLLLPSHLPCLATLTVLGNNNKREYLPSPLPVWQV